MERGFSLFNRLLPHDRASMSEDTLNSKLGILDGMRFYHSDIQLIKISNDLLLSAKLASSKYRLYLEEEKKKKEDQELARARKEKDALLQQQTLEAVEKETSAITILQNDLSKSKQLWSEKNKAVDELLTNASKKMDNLNSCKLSDMITVKALIDGATDIRKKQADIQKQEEIIENKLKRKHNLITSFFTKKPK